MKKWIFPLVLVLFLGACQQVPITGRKQVKLLPNSTLRGMSQDEYQSFLSQHTVVTSSPQGQQVVSIGNNLVRAIESYFKQTGKAGYTSDFAWQFNLVQDNTINAWAMPGGKTVVYTGILPITQTEDGLAVVMGHEVAHAVAHHGNERMSQALAVQMGGLALDVALRNKPEQTRNLFLQAYGVTAQVGAILPFSRLHESEADELGLIFMAMAGYNPEAAVSFWQRMDDASNGQAPPEFLSTHPSHSTRISDLKATMPKAKEYAQKYGI